LGPIRLWCRVPVHLTGPAAGAASRGETASDVVVLAARRHVHASLTSPHAEAEHGCGAHTPRSPSDRYGDLVQRGDRAGPVARTGRDDGHRVRAPHRARALGGYDGPASRASETTWRRCLIAGGRVQSGGARGRERGGHRAVAFAVDEGGPPPAPRPSSKSKRVEHARLPRATPRYLNLENPSARRAEGSAGSGRGCRSPLQRSPSHPLALRSPNGGRARPTGEAL
jgi:hypothetical protein